MKQGQKSPVHRRSLLRRRAAMEQSVPRPTRTARAKAPGARVVVEQTILRSVSDRSEKASAWQNPIIGYFSAKYPRFRLSRPKPSKQARLERQIMLMLAFFSISIGLWENFRQLWLQGNGYSATDVSNIISIATIISALGALWLSKYIKTSQLKRFMGWTLVFRCVNFLILVFLNYTGLRILIDIFSITEIFTSSLFLTSVYPLITLVNKNNEIFSRRKLVEYLFRDVGILVGGVFIGQQLGGFMFSYNACLVLALIFLIIATICMWRVNLVVTERSPEQASSIIKTVQDLAKNKIQRVYMIYVFLTEIAFSTAMGLKMLMLTDSFGFSAGIATNYLLVAGLIADFVGILALKYFTPKNDYATVTLKFGIRFVTYSLAAISGSTFLCFLAFTWAILSSTAYENITEGHYINAIDNRHQFKYNTVRHVIQYFGAAIGTFLCGQMFGFGPAAVFGLASFVVICQLVPAYYLVYLRHQTRKLSQRLDPPYISKKSRKS